MGRVRTQWIVLALAAFLLACGATAWSLEPLGTEESKATCGRAPWQRAWLKYCDGPLPCSAICSKTTFECRHNLQVPNHCEGQYLMGSYGTCTGFICDYCDWRYKECWQRYWGDWYERPGQGFDCWGGCPTYQYGDCHTTECQ